MSDHDLHTLTGAYAVDALGPAEQLSFEQHLAECATCRQEVRELRATAARLAGATGAPPPDRLRAAVLAEVASTRQLSPGGEVVRLPSRRTPPPWYRQPATAAAALLLVVATGLGGLNVAQRQQVDEANDRAARIAAVAADPDRVDRTVQVDGGGQVTVVVAQDIAVLHGRGLARLPEGKAYQLWRIRGQESQSAGVLGRGGELTGLITGMAPDDVVGVTVEPASGSEQPTTEPVVLVSMA